MDCVLVRTPECVLHDGLRARVRTPESVLHDGLRASENAGERVARWIACWNKGMPECVRE